MTQETQPTGPGQDTLQPAEEGVDTSSFDREDMRLLGRPAGVYVMSPDNHPGGRHRAPDAGHVPLPPAIERVLHKRYELWLAIEEAWAARDGEALRAIKTNYWMYDDFRSAADARLRLLGYRAVGRVAQGEVEQLSASGDHGLPLVPAQKTPTE